MSRKFLRLPLVIVCLLLMSIDAVAAAPARTWTDVRGRTLRAAYVGVEDGKVQLTKTDGSVVAVPLDRLSEADQAWVAKQTGGAAEANTGSAAASGADWPCFNGPNHDGKSHDKHLLKQWPEGGAPLAWKADDIGAGYSSATVAAGTVYITGEKNEHTILFAFDLAGKPKWQANHGPDHWGDHPGARASVTVDGDNLYLLGSTGGLGCYDARTGKRKWLHTAAEFGGHAEAWGYAESVLIYNKLAIFKPGGKNFMVALDKLTGRPAWMSQGFESAPEYSSCLPVLFQGTPMLVTGSKQGLVSISPRNGGVLWKNGFAAGNIANCPTPAYADGHVFWANGYGKGGVCVKLSRGGSAQEVWKTRDMECHHGGYVIEGGYIYGNHGGGWSCLELTSGKKMWHASGVGKGSLCWADGMLYLFSEENGQAALATCSPQGLEIKGRVKVDGDGPSWAHPVVAGGKLYLRYATNLYCFDVRAK